MIYPPGISVKSIADPVTPEAIERLSASGFRTFETTSRIFGTTGPEELKSALMAMIRSTGRTSPTHHAPYGTEYDLSAPDEGVRQGAVAQLRALFPEAERFDAGLLVVHGSFEPVIPEARRTHLSQLRKSLHELDAGLKDAGFRLALELLPRTCIGNTGAELLALLEGFDETFGVCLDVNHMMSRSDELARTVLDLDRRLLSLHISDYDGIDEAHWLPGQGIIRWEAFFAALNRIGYAGVFNYELRLPGLSPAERIAAVERNYTDFLLPLMQAAEAS